MKFILLWFLEKCPWDLSKSTPRVAIAWSRSPREFTSVTAIASAIVFAIRATTNLAVGSPPPGRAVAAKGARVY